MELLIDRLRETQNKCLDIFQESERSGRTLNQEAYFLQAILDQILPVINEIDYPLEIRYYLNGQDQDDEWDYYIEPGVTLIYEYNKRFSDKNTRWKETGYQINFTRSGRLLRFDRHGEGSIWPGEKNFWLVEIAEINPRTALAESELSVIFKRLSQTLAAAVKRKGFN